MDGVLEKLGLAHEQLLELNPRLIVARMPPLGMSGPMSSYLGYGPNFNSLVGIAAMNGYEGETRTPRARTTTWTRPRPPGSRSPCSPRCSTETAPARAVSSSSRRRRT